MPVFTPNHILPFRPLRGGMAVQNTVLRETGTIGFVATTDGQDRWIVSCYHVLCRNGGQMPQGVTETIDCPFENAPRPPVALITDAKASLPVDCAAALVPNGAAIGQILGIGTLTLPPRAATIGMRVIKSGAATGVTEARVERLGVDERGIPTVEITGPGLHADYELSRGGDSGALWVDADTHAPVALHLGGNARGAAEFVRARPIDLVLAALAPLAFVPG